MRLQQQSTEEAVTKKEEATRHLRARNLGLSFDSMWIFMVMALIIPDSQAFYPARLPCTFRNGAFRTRCSMTGRPGLDKNGNEVYCGDRNPAMNFFKEATRGKFPSRVLHICDNYLTYGREEMG